MKRLQWVSTLMSLSVVSAQELRLNHDDVVRYNRQFYTGHFDTIEFTTTYEAVDTEGLSFNVNVSCVVIKDFYEDRSTTRGAGEAGTFLRTVIDSDTGTTSEEETSHSNNTGATDTALGNIDENDLIFNLADDTFVLDGASFSISGTGLQFSIPAELSLPEYGVYEVFLTNDIGERLSDVQLITFGHPGVKESYLVGYDFDNGEGALTLDAAYIQPNVTASAYGVGAGLNALTTSSGNGLSESTDADGTRFGTTNPFVFGGTRDALGFSDYANEDSLTEALAADEYMTFTVTPTGIYALNLSGLSFRSRVESLASSANRWAVFSSIHGFDIDHVIQTGLVTQEASYVSNRIDLFSPSYQNITEPVTFRIYVYGGGSESASSETLFDKVMLKGTATAGDVLVGYDFATDDEVATVAASLSDHRLLASDYGVGEGLDITIDQSDDALSESTDAQGLAFGAANGFSFGGVQADLGFSDQDNTANIEQALLDGDYMTFSLSPRTIHKLDLTSLSFRARVTSLDNSAEHWALFSSVNGFETANVIQSGSVGEEAVFTNHVVDLTAIEYQALTDTVSFRLYVYGGNANDASSTLFDKVIVRGRVSQRLERGYNEWLTRHSLDPEGAVPGGSEYDHDGIANVLEYILQGNPRGNDRGASIMPVMNFGSGSRKPESLSYRRNSSSSHDTKQVVEYSTDLSTWYDLVQIDNMIPDKMVSIQAESAETDLVSVDLRAIVEELEASNEPVFIRLSADYTDAEE